MTCDNSASRQPRGPSTPGAVIAARPLAVGRSLRSDGAVRPVGRLWLVAPRSPARPGKLDSRRVDVLDQLIERFVRVVQAGRGEDHLVHAQVAPCREILGPG